MSWVMRKPFYPSAPSDEKGLEYFYIDRRALADFRRGPLGGYFDGFAAGLKQNGYANKTACMILGPCCVFNAFLIERGIKDLTAISDTLVGEFLAAYLGEVRSTCSRYRPRDNCVAHLKHLFLYLEAIKVMAFPRPAPVITKHSWLLDPYAAHLREERIVALVTFKRHVAHTTAFLESLKGDAQRSRLRAMRAEQMESHLRRYIQGSSDNAASLSSSLRVFLAYCARHGHTQRDFTGLVPRQRLYRHASLPRGVDDSSLERVLAMIDKQTPNGARDYAIILVLMAYGVRAVSAAHLSLEDLDWPQAKIRFRAQKGGKEVLVPLLDAVGEAIIQWLRHRDPRTPHREVFLSTKAPHGSLTSMAVSNVVKHYMLKAGVHQPGRGAHSLRHSWAIRALEHDQPIKAIADVLGHRYIDTTYIYAKADLKTLRQVAMPWPRR